jgi:TolA-binding protein
MTRLQPIRRDLDASRELLAAIDGASEEAALRDLLKGQLDAQLALDDTRTQVRQLEGKIAELQGQLEALRAIEADLTEGRRYRESRSQ